MFPVLSTTIIPALGVANPRSSIASQSLLDAFLVNKQIAMNPRGYQLDDTLTSGTKNGDIILPSWSPWSPSDGNDSASTNSNLVQICCNHDLMESLMKLDTRVLATIYGDFFNALFEKGRAKKLVSGRMTYNVLTPPWLRVSVIFLYGSSYNISLPFSSCELPRKNILREKGKSLLVVRLLLLV